MRKLLLHPAAKLLPLCITLLILAAPLLAQITINHSFTSGTVIDPDQMNTNFNTVGNNALNRTGGTLTGNMTANANVTIDGADISDYLDGSGNITATGTLAVTGASTLTGKVTAPNSVISLRAVNYTLPAADAAGSLTSNGSGTLSWAVATNALLDGSRHTDTTASAVTRGDLAYGNATPAWDDLALGTSSKYLRSNGTDLSWSWPALDSYAATQTLTDSNDYVIVTATATINLPACGTRAGKWFHIKNTGAAATITLDANASETIDGDTSYVFSQQYASISIVCDGTGWHIF